MSHNYFGSQTMTQVALIVRDIEAKVKIYADLFGVEIPAIIETAPESEAHTRYQGEPTEARAKLAFFDMGSLTLELIEPIGGPSTWADFLDQHGEGVHHIAFNIEGMDEVTAGLAEQGIPTVQRGDYTGGHYAYVDSAAKLGVAVELLESLKD